MGNAQKSKIAPKKGPRPSKASRWRAAVLIGVHVLVAIHVAHWMSTGSTMTPLEPSEAMEFSKYSVVNAGLVFFALTILSTLILGRWFCGWACHVVALQDLSRAVLLKLGIRPRPLRSRWMAWMPMAGALYMFAWPLVYRLWIGDSLEVREVELTREGFWDTFPAWGTALFTFFIAGFLAVYFLGAKGFCTYACPYGALFSLADRASPGRIRVNDDCVECGHCTLTCSSNVDVSREVHDYGMVVDPGCMKCMDCVSVCPEHALSFGMGKPALFAKLRQEPRAPRRRLPRAEELLGVVAFGFGYFAMRGFHQQRGFLLSVGVAACFAFLALLVLRLVRKNDVRIPGVTLKQGGRWRAAGMATVAGTFALTACAVPYGLVPEMSARRAAAAWQQLADVRSRFFTPNAAPLSTDERDALAELSVHSRRVRERTLEPSVENTERLAWAALLNGDFERLDRHLDELVQFRTVRVEHLLLYAAHKAETGNDVQADWAYRNVLAQHPREHDAVLGLSGLLFRRGNADEARELLDGSLQRSPSDRSLILQRASFDVTERKLDDALTSLEDAIRADPTFFAAREFIFQIRREQGRPQAALEVLRAGMALEGAPREFRAHVAQILLISGRTDEAVAEARLLETEGDPALLEVARAIYHQVGGSEDLARVEARLRSAASGNSAGE